MIGRVLDNRYRVEQLLGRGGMGQVYLARHEVLGEPVAIKVLTSDEPQAGRRFLREAKNTFRLDHPNCVRVTDAGATDAGELYLVMEYLDGRSLGEEITVDGALAPIRVAHIGSQIAAALAHAHELGFVHRDLKPENIMLVRRGGDDDFAKVLDFGLAKLYDDSVIGTQLSIQPLTREGVVFGTPEYMSPEQALGKPLGPASDLYSLGVLLFHAATATLPFQSEKSMELLASHVRERPPRLSERVTAFGIDRLEPLIEEMLHKKPDQRPAGARAVAAALAAAHHDLATATARPDTRPFPSQVSGSETINLTDDPPPLVPGTRASAAQAATPTPAVVPSQQPTQWPSLEVDGAPPLATASGQPRLRSSGARRLASRRRAVIAIGVTLAVLAGAVVVAAQLLGDQARAPAAVDAGVATAVKDPADARPAAADASAPAPTAPDAAPPPRADAAPQKTAKQRKLERLIAAAKRAKRSGNTLGQLSNAQQAYKLDRNSSDARYLFGDALARSGDPANKARGCKLLARWKSRFKRAGCTD